MRLRFTQRAAATSSAMVATIVAAALATIPATAVDTLRDGAPPPAQDSWGQSPRIDWNDPVVREWSLCNNPPKFRDITCLRPPAANGPTDPGGACPDPLKYVASVAVCRLKIYMKNPNDAQEFLAGTCTGWLLGQTYIYSNPWNNVPGLFEAPGPRHDIIITARHCIDRVYDNCRRAAQSSPPFEEPRIERCVVRIVCEFEANYAADCGCTNAPPDPPCAEPCGTPNRGMVPPGSNPGSPGLPDPARPCAKPTVWVATSFGFDAYDTFNAPDNTFNPPVPDERNGNCDWGVIRVSPNPNIPVETANEIRLPGLPGDYYSGLPVFGITPPPEPGDPPLPPDIVPVPGGGLDLFIVQHPRGRCKEVASGPFHSFPDVCTVAHRVDTEGGSSGSPVCGTIMVNNQPVLASLGVHSAGGCTAPNMNFNQSVGSVRLLSPLISGNVRIYRTSGGNAQFPFVGSRPLNWAIRMTDAPRGDINMDKLVNADDLAHLLRSFPADGCNDGRYIRTADFNCDTKIDLVDYQYWYQAYLAFNNPAAVYDRERSLEQPTTSGSGPSLHIPN